VELSLEQFEETLIQVLDIMFQRALMEDTTDEELLVICEFLEGTYARGKVVLQQVREEMERRAMVKIAAEITATPYMNAEEL
jgi:hypothetical protein